MSAGLLALTVFIATTVEMVEALTIVLAVGVSRGWRSTLQGALVAVLALVLLVAIFGASLATVVPLQVLRFFVGLGLLLFGLSWLRKAIERQAGRRPLRNEATAFDRLVAQMGGVRRTGKGLDPAAFAASFKGVLLEGVEAAVIVVTVGLGAHRMPIAVFSALIAVVFVVLLGVILHRPLTRIPENAMKLGVGLLLSSFGTFWVLEGLGVELPGAELAILYIALVYAAITSLVIWFLSRASKEAGGRVAVKAERAKSRDKSGKVR